MICTGMSFFSRTAAIYAIPRGGELKKRFLITELSFPLLWSEVTGAFKSKTKGRLVVINKHFLYLLLLLAFNHCCNISWLMSIRIWNQADNLLPIIHESNKKMGNLVSVSCFLRISGKNKSRITQQ
jgi:hypothetical protein